MFEDRCLAGANDAVRPAPELRCALALTYPQLMNQAIAAAVDADALVRLRATYELAERLADGVYRPQGEPLLCHLVRTASIVLAEDQPLPVVQAALLHAAYSLRARVGEANEHGSRRAWLRTAAGPEVEQLVFAYDQLPWNSSAQLKRHVEGFASLRSGNTLGGAAAPC